MAVIITDMDMPKRCVECPMHENSNDYCKFRHDFSCFVRAKNACSLKSADEMFKEIKIRMWNWRGKESISIDKIAMEKILNEIIHKFTDKEQTNEEETC